MKPLKLEMQAFGPYAKREVVDFEQIDRGLFLINGPTGSGKTTIFDAIKYALYGMTSTAERRVQDMRSSHAAPDLPTYVDLVFEHGGDVFHIERRSAQMVPKKRGTGYTEMKPEASLQNLTTGVSLASKDTAVNAYVNELLGIDAEQFGRIVMISQNDFASVLNAKTEEREKLFRKIFGTEIYERVQKKLDALRKNIESRLKSVHDSIELELRRIEPPVDEALRDRFENLSSGGASYVNAPAYSELLIEMSTHEEQKSAELSAEQERARERLSILDRQIGEARTIAQARQQAQEALEWIESNEQRVQAARERCESLEALAPEREKLDARTRSLEDSIPKYDELEEKRKDRAMLQRKLEELTGQSEASAEEIMRDKGKIVECQGELNSLQGADVGLERSVSQKETIERKEQQIRELEELVAKGHVLESELEEAQRIFLEAEHELRRANDAYDAAQTAYFADRAGLLAEGLEQGNPCPVCGSTEHPHLARRIGGVPSDEQLEALSQELDAKRTAREQAAIEAEAARTRLAFVQDGIQQSAKEILQRPLDSIEDALLRQREALLVEKAQVQDDIAQARSKVERASTLGDEIGALQDAVESLTERRSAMQEQIGQANIKASLLDASISDLSASLEHPSKEIAAEMLAESKSRLQAMMNDHERAREDLQSLESSLKEKQALIDATSNIAPTADALDLPLLLQQREDAAAEEERLREDNGEILSLMENHKACLAGLERLEDADSELNERYVALSDLANLSNGNMAGELGKVSFERYVQGIFFKRILAAANDRLNIMSSGRYALEQSETSTDNRSKGGLNISVFDRYSGTARPSQTLSGGETFLASLALALGLSDVIMEQAGGMHVDAMFVDEGFGSLDDETCQLAISVLDKLSSDDRMIGIISHVADLKDRIPTQIQVVKTQDGSTLNMVV